MSVEETEASQRVAGAEALALALDTDDLVDALRTARDLRPYFSVAKVGLELFAAAGPEAIGSLRRLGYEVFADLKMFDIPTTVGRAARVVGSLGARYLTLHARDDLAMLRAGVEGFSEGAAMAGLDEPVALGVTVLTSDGEAPSHIVPRRVATAIEAGCGGIVCAGSDLADVRSIAPAAVLVTPGIRPAGAGHDDQARVSEPAAARAAGADLLVIGRAVTAAQDPVAAAAAIAAEVAQSR